MILHKFLAEGAVGPFSRFRWPTPDIGPGDWVAAADGELEVTRNGIHACRTQHLGHWVEHELWEIEIDGEMQEADRHVVARRGRLTKRIDGWHRELANEFQMALMDRTRNYTVTALRSRGLDDIAASLTSAPDPISLAMAAGQAVPAVPDELVPIMLDAADAAFAAPMPVRPCMLTYVAARSARLAAMVTGTSVEEADAAERRWQGEWLADALDLVR